MDPHRAAGEPGAAKFWLIGDYACQVLEDSETLMVQRCTGKEE